MIREILAPLGSISSRRMFGGASLYCDGTLFALVDDDVLYLKADDVTKALYEAEGCKPFTYDGQTGPVSMSYWRAPDRLYDEQDEFLQFAREALRVAATAPASKERRKSSTVAKGRSSAQKKPRRKVPKQKA